MTTADFIAGISAAFEAIQTWLQFQDGRRADEVFERQFRSTLSSADTEQRAAALSSVVPEAVLNDLMERARQCWARYRHVLVANEFLPAEIDEATTAVRKCVCRELGRIVELNGSIPDAQLDAQWNCFCTTR